MKYFKLKFLLLFFALAVTIPPAWAETVTDVIDYNVTKDLIGNTGATAWADLKIEGQSGAKYVLHTMGNLNENQGICWNKNGYLYTTESPGKLKSVTFIGNTGTGDNRAVRIFAQNIAYTGKASGDDYIKQVQFDNEGITYIFTDEYKYIAINGTASNTLINSISIEWEIEEGGETPQPADVTLSFPEDSYTATLGQTFNAPTLSVDPAGAASEVTYSSSNTGVAMVDEETGAITLVAAGTTTITAEISGSETYNNATASYTLTVEKAPEPSGNEYVLVKDIADLATGKHIIFVNKDNAKAMSSTQSGNNRPATDITISESNVATATEATEIFTLEQTQVEDVYYWLFKASKTPGYIYAAGANSNNYLKTEEKADNRAQATVTIASDGEATVVFNAGTRNTLKYNSSNDIFSCYASGQLPVYIFIEKSGDTPQPTQVATPTFKPAQGEYTEAQNVTITCATEDAVIHYTVDGTDPTAESPVYDEAIAVGETMTIKAIAMKEGMTNSNVATAEYIINLPQEVATITAAQALGDNATFNFTGNAVVTFHNGNHLYIRDGSDSGLIYGVDAATKKYDNGDVLTAGWKAKNDVYQVHTPEFTDPSNVGSTVNNGAVEPLPLTTIELGDVNKYAKIDNVTITSNNGQNYYYMVGENQYCLRRAYTDMVGELDVNKTYNVTGVVTIFRSGSKDNYIYTPQLNLISAELIKEDLTLSFDPASVELYVGETFTAPALKGVPEGATIDVTYSSNNTDVAIVTDNVVSLVKGATGTAIITATFAGNDEYNKASATYTIKVKAKEAAGLSYGEEPVTVAATYGDTEFTEPELTNAAGLAVTYSTSNDKVATVDEEGNVTIVGAGTGTATITATTEGDASHAGGSASYTINVAKAEAKVTFSEHEYTVYVNAKFTEPTLTTDPKGLEVTYSIKGNDSEIVLFDEEDGTVVIGEVPGTVTITATFAGNDNYKEASDSYTITVKAKEVATLSFDVEGITVYPNAEDFTQPKLTTTPENLTVTYTSTDDNIATVVDGVLMIGDKTGTATITATFAGNDTYGTATATYTVTVEPRPIVVADDVVEFELYVGQTETKTFTVMAENLKGDITLTLSDETGFYSIEPTTIDMDDAESATVTVTYAPTTEGFHEATVTLSTKDAEENVTVTLTGMAEAQPVVAMPTFSLVAGSYTGPQTVTIYCATEDATISYSTDGGQTWTEGNTVNVDKDMTIMAKASKDGYTISETATGYYVIDIPEALPTDMPTFDGYYSVLNSGKYANIQGRKTLTFTDAPDAQAGTVIRLKSDNTGKVEVLRSQAADLQRYAYRAMDYVPDIVQIVVDKLGAEGEGHILGKDGLDAIMTKFDESFKPDLYIEKAGDNGYRIYGRTPSMQPVVDFYRENKDKVEAKLPDLVAFINSALAKLRNKANQAGMDGDNVFVDFDLKTIWTRMGGNLTDPEVDEMGFYRDVLNYKDNVWNFAYQTATFYLEKIKNTGTYTSLSEQLGEFAQYLDKIDQIHPDFKYYIVANEEVTKPDFISQGNADIINKDPRTIWTLEPRTDFTVNFPETNKHNGEYVTTLYTDFAYTLPEGVTAWAVTSVSDQGIGELTAIDGTTIAAQTPVLLKSTTAGDVATFGITTADGTAAPEGNLLVGPDYLIETYQIKTPEVVKMFEAIKTVLGENIYNDLVDKYGHLQFRTSGTVNNKYFWGLNEEEVKSCAEENPETGKKVKVVRSLGIKDDLLGFNDNEHVYTNKALLVSTEHSAINFSLRGDINKDGVISIIDVTALIDILLDGPNQTTYLEPTPSYPKGLDYEAANVNENEEGIEITDVTTLIDILLNMPDQPAQGSGN